LKAEQSCRQSKELMVKTSFNKPVSKKLSDELTEYHSKVKQKSKPRNPMYVSTMFLSDTFDEEPYQNQLIHIRMDHTGEHLIVEDGINGYQHTYNKHCSQSLSDPNLITIEKLEAKLLKDLEQVATFNKQNGLKWTHSELGINLDCSLGAFLELGEPRPHDFIPVIATSQEMMLSADAVLGLGGSYDLGGRALMHINTKYAKKGKRIRESWSNV